MRYEMVGNRGTRTHYDDRDAALRGVAGEASASVKGMARDYMTAGFAADLVEAAESRPGECVSREFRGSAFQYGSNAGDCPRGNIGLIASV